LKITATPNPATEEYDLEIVRFETWGVLPKPSHRNQLVNFRYASLSSSRNIAKSTGSQKTGAHAFPELKCGLDLSDFRRPKARHLQQVMNASAGVPLSASS